MTTTDKFASRPNNAAIAIAEERYRALIRPHPTAAIQTHTYRAYTHPSANKPKHHARAHGQPLVPPYTISTPHYFHAPY